jgi:predicted PurR-regulated permease PerM
MSVSGGAVFYRTRTNPTISKQNQTSIKKNQKSFVSERQTILQKLVSMKISSFLMIFFILLLILLFFFSIYLVLRLDFIQAKVDLAQPTDFSHPKKQILLHSQTSRKVKEYLDMNMDQISQV